MVNARNKSENNEGATNKGRIMDNATGSSSQCGCSPHSVSLTPGFLRGRRCVARSRLRSTAIGSAYRLGVSRRIR